MSSAFWSLFEEKLDDESHLQEVPLFDLPGENGTVTLIPCSLNFWFLSFLFLGFNSLVNCVVGLVAYFFVVKAKDPSFAYMVGYGLICPFLLYLPFVVIEYFDLRNMALILCAVGSTPSLLLFRCVEAMHKTLPTFAQRDFRGFMLYYTGTLQFRFDDVGEPIRLTRKDAYQKTLRFISVMLQTSLLYSILIPSNYSLFQVPGGGNSIRRLLSWQSLMNNLSMAALTSLTLEAGASGLGLITSLLTGISTMSFSNYPLTRSTSPSDFWGRRWNRIIGSGLRRGVYVPARKVGMTRLQGAVLTFATSGILHEYMLLFMTFRGGDKTLRFSPQYGNHLIFFLWCGVVIVLEAVVGRTSIVNRFSQSLWRPFRTFLVLLTVLPIGHFFTDEYVANSFYGDIALGFPRLRVAQEV